MASNGMKNPPICSIVPTCLYIISKILVAECYFLLTCRFATDVRKKAPINLTYDGVQLTPDIPPAVCGQAEEITLTIGQAFDLAYRQFLDSSGRDLENRKQMMILQKRLALVQAEAEELRRRLRAVSELAPQAALQDYCRKNLVSHVPISRLALLEKLVSHILSLWYCQDAK